MDFECWLQWIAAEQVTAAQSTARESGMALGLVQDIAVGVHALGADVWWNPERFAKGATVGAPPDMFNQQGQDWSQPPLNPIALERTGYKVYRDMVHGMFANAGAVGGFVRRAAGSVCDCAILRSATPLRASLCHLARGCTI